MLPAPGHPAPTGHTKLIYTTGLTDHCCRVADRVAPSWLQLRAWLLPFWTRLVHSGPAFLQPLPPSFWQQPSASWHPSQLALQPAHHKHECPKPCALTGVCCLRGLYKPSLLSSRDPQLPQQGLTRRSPPMVGQDRLPDRPSLSEDQRSRHLLYRAAGGGRSASTRLCSLRLCKLRESGQVSGTPLEPSGEPETAPRIDGIGVPLQGGNEGHDGSCLNNPHHQARLFHALPL